MSLDERKREVPGDFDRIAGSYDLMTGMNPGYHRHLRMSAERLELEGSRPRILDLCCGTGLSTEALAAVYPRAELVALDASAGMLEVARRKPVLRGARFIHGDATDPRAAGVDGDFDGVLMAYGLRNLPDPDRGLANIIALLRPGGRLCLHEYSVRGSWRSRLVWDAVCWGIIVPGGMLTARGSGIYRYLRRSVVDFDSVTELEARMKGAGFTKVWTGPMDGWQRGIVHSFVGTKPSGRA
ncbi:MAG: class I SAM-dependent methyltransferase [Sandaracinaceae bacterium]|nr:class I SAM-dependent methyltransferase [Sandaracinaceae bacterium]